MIADSTDLEKYDDRGAVRILREFVRRKWPIPDAVIDAAPKVVARVLTDETSTKRDKLRAAEVLAALQRDNLSAILALDKVERLDGGDATENVVLTLLPSRFSRHASSNPGA